MHSSSHLHHASAIDGIAGAVKPAIAIHAAVNRFHVPTPLKSSRVSGLTETAPTSLIFRWFLAVKNFVSKSP
jgi:hypothetical protein